MSPPKREQRPGRGAALKSREYLPRQSTALNWAGAITDPPALWHTRRPAHVLLDLTGSLDAALDALLWGSTPAAIALVAAAGGRARAREALRAAVIERRSLAEREAR